LWEFCVATTDTLRKPDMPAVVQRTHISHDLHGLLLPVFEAISNSIHGIERRFPDSAATSGRIWIQFIRTGEPAKFRISVCDNGVGLDKENYDSFLTPFSGLKLAKRGRGFGRFIAFKVFKRILYSSNYGEDAAAASRTFRFNIYDDREVIYFDGTPDFKGPGVCVDYDELRDECPPLRAPRHRGDPPPPQMPAMRSERSTTGRAPSCLAASIQ
jgi:hypothetical protein